MANRYALLTTNGLVESVGPSRDPGGSHQSSAPDIEPKLMTRTFGLPERLRSKPLMLPTPADPRYEGTAAVRNASQ